MECSWDAGEMGFDMKRLGNEAFKATLGQTVRARASDSRVAGAGAGAYGRGIGGQLHMPGSYMHGKDACQGHSRGTHGSSTSQRTSTSESLHLWHRVSCDPACQCGS